MNKYTKIVGLFLVFVFGLVSCAPINTPDPNVNRANAEANQRVANGAGVAALGLAAVIASAALYKREQRRARKVYYAPWGGYRYQYWHPRYGWVWR